MTASAPQRKIIHIDMDAFYAAVEQRDNPLYRGKPVIVGGQPNSRGVVATASYEARRFGIHSAMPSAHAFRLCPNGIFVSPRFEVYHEVSEEIMDILRSYTILVEAVSLDEAYLDVTALSGRFARDIAAEIKEKIRRSTSLTASAGVAPNKFIAKIASDFRKPDGLCVVPPDKVASFLTGLPVRKIPGVGPVTEARLQESGISTIDDVRRYTEQELTAMFGSMGGWLFEISQGRDEREVEPSRERKSLGAEETFARDLIDLSDMEKQLRTLAVRVAEELNERGLAGRTITLKVTYTDFEKITRRMTLDAPVNDASTIAARIMELLARTSAGSVPIRLLGVCVSNFHGSSSELPEQLCFYFMRP